VKDLNGFRDTASKRIKSTAQFLGGNDRRIFSDTSLVHNSFKLALLNHLWSTCVQPETIVSEYGEYSHENARDERKLICAQDTPHKVLNIRSILTI
jgi:hypothetical protein